VDLNCVVGWSDWIIAAQLVVQGLEAMGVSTKLRTYDFGAWFSQLQRGEFQLSLGWSSGGPSLYTFYGRQMSSASLRPIGQPAEYNWQRFASPEADRLLAELAKTADPSEEERLSRSLVKLFVRTAPAIPLFPGPAFGQYNSERIEGFPTEDDPYVALAPYKIPGFLLALVELRPKGMPRRPDPLGILSAGARAGAGP
jgi:peptide/nickel transport system substrate-binding protein